MTNKQLESLALEAGALKATVIPVSQVVLSREFRAICEQNGCGNFGRCWMCPPHTGNIDDMMNQLRSFDRALLFQTVTPLEDSFDIEGMTAASHAHASLTLVVRDRLRTIFPNVLVLGCGGCRLCDACAAVDGLPCRHPNEALSSLECFGVDVYKTVQPTPLKYINGPDTVTFFSAALLPKD